jgi:hypothetical protein
MRGRLPNGLIGSVIYRSPLRHLPKHWSEHDFVAHQQMQGVGVQPILWIGGNPTRLQDRKARVAVHDPLPRKFATDTALLLPALDCDHCGGGDGYDPDDGADLFVS